MGCCCSTSDNLSIAESRTELVAAYNPLYYPRAHGTWATSPSSPGLYDSDALAFAHPTLDPSLE